MFLLKKLLGVLLMPLAFGLGLVVAGLLLVLAGRRTRTGWAVTLAGALLLGLCSVDPVADRLLSGLESRYPPLLTAGDLPPDISSADVKWIVVLGGGHRPNPDLPPSARLRGASLQRLVEGVRLQGFMGQATLLLCGGPPGNGSSDAQALGSAALTLGVSPHRMLLEDRSLDTDDQARLAGEIVGGDPFCLVTSAAHMPRAVALFRSQGLSPIPAPTDYLAVEPAFLRFRRYLPSVSSLEKSHKALHEYLGLAWLRLRLATGASS